MTGFNKNTSKWLKKLSSDKKFKYKLTSRCVFPLSPLFCPSSLQYSSSIVKYTKPFQSNFRDFSPFSTRKTLPWVFSSECLQSNSQCEGTASCKCIKTGGNFGAKRTHCCGFWLDVSFFFTREKISFVILIGRIAFFTCEKHCSLLWLPRTHFRMNLRHSLYNNRTLKFSFIRVGSHIFPNYRNTAWGLRGVCGPHNLAELSINNRIVNLEHLIYPRIFGVHPHA